MLINGVNFCESRINIGNKLLCKNNYEHFLKGLEYTIVSIDKSVMSVLMSKELLLSDSLSSVKQNLSLDKYSYSNSWWFEVLNLSKYFYTIKEMRKIKLERLGQC